MFNSVDIIMAGAGIVGLATVHRLLSRNSGLRVLVIEKEAQVAQHQSGHNSGVLHSGIYYKPGSLKARLCHQGRLQMIALCERLGVPYSLCGKVIVATNQAEASRLEAIEKRGSENGVTCHWLDQEELKKREPHVVAVRALWVHDTGVVDYRAVAGALQRELTALGVQFFFGRAVTAISERTHEVVVRCGDLELTSSWFVNCCGLHSDRVARLSGLRPDAQIMGFRGEYYTLRPERSELCRGLIYPVPDPAFPFLGVHLTRGIDDTVECGPNAVLALRREGYRGKDVALDDVMEMLAFPGAWRLVNRYWLTGCAELWRSLSKASFARALARLVPDLEAQDLIAAAAGVRAQAVRRDGTLEDDFVIQQTRRCVHVLNAPSPAATASLAIGDHIAALLLTRMDR